MKSLRSLRSMMLIPTFGLLAAVAACSGQAATDGNGTTSTAVTASAKDQGPGPHMGPGPAMLLFASLHEDINLTDAQRATIKGLVDGLRPSGPPNKAALAAAIRAGKIDVAALQPAKPDFAEHNAAVAKALATLHSTLTSEQRVALVAAIKKHAAEHKFGPPHEMGEKGDGPKGGMKMHGGPGHFGPMRMMEDLDLTDAQKTAIEKELDVNKPEPPTGAEREAMKKKHAAMRTEMDARLDKFAAATFDANAFVAPPSDAPALHHGDRFLENLAVIVPLLTPAQREKLATKIEQGPKQ